MGSLHSGIPRLPPRPPLLLQSTEIKSGLNRNCSELLLVGFDPSSVSLDGVCGDTDNISSVAGQLGLDVGELLHHLGTLPVGVVEHNNQVSDLISIFNFTFYISYI